MLLVTVVLFFSSSSAQIRSSTAVADILPLTRLLGGTLRFHICEAKIRHIHSTLVGPSGFYKFPSLSAFRVSLVLTHTRLRQWAQWWAWVSLIVHSAVTISPDGTIHNRTFLDTYPTTFTATNLLFNTVAVRTRMTTAKLKLIESRWSRHSDLVSHV